MKKQVSTGVDQDPMVLVSKADQRAVLEKDVQAFLLAGGEVEVLPPSGTRDIIRRAIEGMKYEKQIRLMHS